MPQWMLAVVEAEHLLGGIALALAFALLIRRGPVAMVRAVRAQSVVVAIAAALQARAQGSVALWGLLLVVLIGGAATLPSAIRRQADAAPYGFDDAPRTVRAITVAAAVVVLAIMAAMPARLPGLPPMRENLALALATALVALLVLATRRAALAQLIGLQALANGAALLAAVAGARLPGVLAVAALFGFVAAGLAAQPAKGDPE